MNDTVKLIIEIPKEDYEFTKGAKMARVFPSEYYVKLILNGTPLDDVKAEIEKKCNRINSIANFLKCPLHLHGEIQDLLCEILTSIDNAESIDPNDLTHIFDGVTEIPKDIFKGWNTEELSEQIRAESEDKE